MTDDFAQWLKKQKAWVQLAFERLVKFGRVTEESIDQFVGVIKNSTQGTPLPQTLPQTTSAVAASLRLDSIGPVVGIDAINPRKPLEFGAGNLSIIYGTNGSGKSGYARILTRACGKPHSVKLKPNVYTELPPRQECTFTYTVGGAKKNTTWVANADSLSELESIDIFDDECGRLYLDKETDLSYEPPALALLADLVKVCHQVDSKLAEEKDKLVCQLPSLPPAHLDTAAAKAYSQLSHKVSESNLDALLAWKATDQAELEEREQLLKIGDPAMEAKRLRNEQKQIDAIRKAIGDAVKALDADSVANVQRLANDAAARQMAAEQGANALGDASKLPATGGETWKAMWEAARIYSTTAAYPGLDFPHTNDDSLCVLCHQPLDATAKTRLIQFEAFVKGKLQTDATTANAALKDHLLSLPSRPEAKSLEASCQAAGLSQDLQSKVEATWNVLESLLTQLRSCVVSTEAVDVDADITKLVDDLVKLSAATVKKAATFEIGSTVTDRVALQKGVRELNAKKWVAEQAGAVRSEVARFNKVSQYEEWRKQAKSAGISRKIGELSQQLITDAYIKRFNDELKNLGAGKIQVELIKSRTVQGKSKHSIRLRDVVVEGSRVAEILSEGERRIVSLAAFLADVTGRPSESPFVFDDPISSLDQLFEEKVIARLIELSKGRQVLVFTHRLSFLGIMSDLAGSSVHHVHIRREPWGTGEPGEVPLFGSSPQKALNKLKNDRLSKAKKAYDEDGSETYYIQAKAICSDFRSLIERIVEFVLLADVVQRHRRAVKTMGKIGNLAKITTSDCELIDELMTKYSRYEHSQPQESPVEMPEPDDLERDMDKMLVWHAEFSKRQ